MKQNKDLFYRLVRKRLLKQGRLLDMLKIKTDGGYSLRKGKGNKYIVELFNDRKRSVKLTVDKEDKELGEDVLNIMHMRGEYVPFNDDNIYPVYQYVFEDNTDLESIYVISSLRKNKKGMHYIPDYELDKSKELNQLVTHYSVSKMVTKIGYTFKSKKEYKDFVKKGYNKVKDNYNYSKITKELMKDIDQEIEYNKRKIEQYKQKNGNLLIKKEELSKEVD